MWRKKQARQIRSPVRYGARRATVAVAPGR